MDLVLDLAENLADLILYGVRSGGLLLETVQVREQLAVCKIAQIVTGQSLFDSYFLPQFPMGYCGFSVGLKRRNYLPTIFLSSFRIWLIKYRIRVASIFIAIS